MSDQQVRLAAFTWLEQQVARYGEVLTEFNFEGTHIALVGQK